MTAQTETIGAGEFLLYSEWPEFDAATVQR